MTSMKISKKSTIHGTTNMLQNERVLVSILSGTDSNKLYQEKGLERNVKADHDVFESFRGLLILGRWLGLVPISGVFGTSHENLGCGIFGIAGITSLLCIALLSFNSGLAILRAVALEKKSILVIAKTASNPLFATTGVFVYVWFFYRRRAFLKIFQAWSRCCQTLTYTKPDTYLYLTVVLISVVMFASTVLENAILHMEYFQYFDDINGHNQRWGKETSNVSIVKMYYWRSHHYWYHFLGYHPILSVMIFIIHKWILYGWNYMDVFSALMFRALYFKFKALCETAEKRLVEPLALDRPDTWVASDQDDRQAWEKLAKDHESLCQVLNVMNEFFSPFLFVSYAVNMYFFCMQVVFGLNPNEVQHSLVHSIYAPWSFIHIVLKVFLVSFFAAKVHEYAHKIREVVIRCPAKFYGDHIARLEKLFNGGQQLGLSGLGCFVITKPFMMSILNVIFTIEIVLLQGLATESSNHNHGC